MRSTLRFLWVATRGYRLRPWHSPYLRWRIETYAGGRAEMIGFREFWRFLWRERRRLRAFLKWVEEMETAAGSRRQARGGSGTPPGLRL